MDQVSKSVANAVENGDYFADARNWYMAKYLYPVTEKSFYTIICIVALLSGSILFYSLYSLFPLVNRLNIAINIDDLTTEYAELNRLPVKGSDVNKSVYEFLTSNFVQLYESYNFENIEAQRVKISNNATKQVYKQFFQHLSLENLKSPVLLLQRDGIRNIEILSVQLNGDIVNPENVLSDQIQGYANINFKATITDLVSRNKYESLWTARVEFLAPDVNRVVYDAVPFKFVVSEDQVQPIKK